MFSLFRNVWAQGILLSCIVFLGRAGVALPPISACPRAFPALRGDTPSAPAQSKGQEPLPSQEPGPAALPPKQRQELLKSSFEKMKRDAEDLASLAQSLQEDLEKSNENVLSLKIVNKADKIERLAKKIKEAAKGR